MQMMQDYSKDPNVLMKFGRMITDDVEKENWPSNR